MRPWILAVATLAVLACQDAPPQATVDTTCTLDGVRLPQGEVRELAAACQRCTCTAAGLACEQLLGCALGQGEPEAAPAARCPVGRITGRACSPNGAAIPGARVTAATVDCEGHSRLEQVRSDDAGHFLLHDLVPGQTTITVTAGRFESRYTVEVEADRTLPLDGFSDKTCLPADAARLAVISGDYDQIESILDRLGFEYDLYCGAGGHTWPARQLLGDWDRLRRYDIVFINCGAHVDLRRAGLGQTMQANLRRFVAEGGSVYASDLSAGIVDRLWSGAVGFESWRRDLRPTDACCSCVDCPERCAFDDCLDCCGVPAVECKETPTLGAGRAGVVQADVVNADLAAFLGADRLQVDFDLDGWVQVDGVSLATDVLVRAGARPLMVLFDVGDQGGRVAYTSFHNRAQLSEEVELILRALVFQL